MKASVSPNSKQSYNINLIKHVAKRVSNLRECRIKWGNPKTDGKTIYLPFNDKKFSYDELEALAAHEGAHIRFKSILDKSLPEKIYKKNPKLGQYLLNICEDARVECLLKKTFLGFWYELDELNGRFLIERINKYQNFSSYKIKPQDFVSLLLLLSSILGCQKDSLIFHKVLRLEEKGIFRFACKEISYFWKEAQKIFKFIRSELTFPSSIIGAKKLVKLMENVLLLKFNSSLEEELDEKKIQLGDLSFDFPNKKRMGSGIPVKKLDKRRKDALNHLKQKIDSKDMDKISLFQSDQPISFSTSQISNDKSEFPQSAGSKGLDEIKKDLSIFREEIEQIIRKLKKKKSRKYSKSSGKQKQRLTKTESFAHVWRDEMKMKCLRFQNVIELKNLNKIQNSSKIYSEISSEQHVIINKLQKRFMPIKYAPQMHRGQRRGYVSGRDLTQVVVSGGRFKNAFRNQIPEKGMQLLILLDESGSMTGKRIKIARKSAIILAETLKKTRIKYAIVGFSAKYGKKILCEKIYKSFQNDVNKQKIGLIGTSKSYNENRDGSSFLHAVKHHFLQIANCRKVLLIISDGRPSHGGTSYRGEKGAEATRSSIKSIEKSNVFVYALSIDPNGARYLSQIYNVQQYEVIENLRGLAKKLMDLVQKIASSLL